MNFSKEIFKDEVIYNINSEIIDEKITDEIIKSINPDLKTGLNMANVSSITSKKFVKYLYENKFKLFNIQSELLSFISLVLKDNFLKTYMNKSDFINDKRELFKRRLYIV